MPVAPLQANPAAALSAATPGPEPLRDKPVSNAAEAGSALSAAAASAPATDSAQTPFPPVTPTSMRLYLMRVPLRDLSTAYDEVRQMLPAEDQSRQPAGSRVPPLDSEMRSQSQLAGSAQDANKSGSASTNSLTNDGAARAAALSATPEKPAVDSAAGRPRADALAAEVKAQEQARPPASQMQAPRADLPQPQDPVPGGVSPFSPAPPPAQQLDLKA